MVCAGSDSKNGEKKYLLKVKLPRSSSTSAPLVSGHNITQTDLLMIITILRAIVGTFCTGEKDKFCLKYTEVNSEKYMLVPRVRIATFPFLLRKSLLLTQADDQHLNERTTYSCLLLLKEIAQAFLSKNGKY